jgi:hypothetical protein
MGKAWRAHRDDLGGWAREYPLRFFGLVTQVFQPGDGPNLFD